MKNDQNPSGYLTRPAIEVSQPLGTFFAFSVSANILSDITYSQPAEIVARMEVESGSKGGYSIFGTQRTESRKRLDEIASFIRTTEATFPNSIILAANYDQDGRYIDDEKSRWSVGQSEIGGCCQIKIPLFGRSASIIDGQHRLHAFSRLPEGAIERSMELLCVVFLELPVPYHAYVFATINFNQKKVDRSLAYDLFGFDVDEKSPSHWSPETLAVYLTRLLNTESSSPLHRSIFPAADSQKVFLQSGDVAQSDIRVSMATVVDGLLRLFSRNPKEDRNVIRRPENQGIGRRSLSPIDGLPLREFYINENDRAIYDLLVNFFLAVKATIWRTAGPASYLRKTIGVQAILDVLRDVLAVREISAQNYSVTALSELLSPCSNLDPMGKKYDGSGIGRGQIREDIKATMRLV